jgi:hypothetical protein
MKNLAFWIKLNTHIKFLAFYISSFQNSWHFALCILRPTKHNLTGESHPNLRLGNRHSRVALPPPRPTVFRTSVNQPRAAALVPLPRRPHLAAWPRALLLSRHHRRHQPWACEMALRFSHAAAQLHRCSGLRLVSQVSRRRRLLDSDSPRPRTMSRGGCRFYAACAVAKVD